MRSTDEMEHFVLGLSREFDNAANMDLWDMVRFQWAQAVH
jgi:hypothetical protein